MGPPGLIFVPFGLTEIDVCEREAPFLWRRLYAIIFIYYNIHIQYGLGLGVVRVTLCSSNKLKSTTQYGLGLFYVAQINPNKHINMVRVSSEG